VLHKRLRPFHGSFTCVCSAEQQHLLPRSQCSRQRRRRLLAPHPTTSASRRATRQTGGRWYPLPQRPSPRTSAPLSFSSASTAHAYSSWVAADQLALHQGTCRCSFLRAFRCPTATLPRPPTMALGSHGAGVLGVRTGQRSRCGRRTRQQTICSLPSSRPARRRPARSHRISKGLSDPGVKHLDGTATLGLVWVRFVHTCALCTLKLRRCTLTKRNVLYCVSSMPMPRQLHALSCCHCCLTAATLRISEACSGLAFSSAQTPAGFHCHTLTVPCLSPVTISPAPPVVRARASCTCITRCVGSQRQGRSVQSGCNGCGA
jgi:hypothetical protein